MATVGIVLGYVQEKRSEVMRSTPRTSEAITTSAASQQAAATALDGEVWMISTTGDVWVRFAANPTAAAGDDFLLPAGSIYHIAAVAGDKCAVINA